MVPRKQLIRGVGGVLGLVTIATSVGVAASQWDQLTESIVGVNWKWLTAGSALLATCYGTLGAAWWQIIRALGGRISAAKALRAFSLAQLPKYVPGRIVAHGIRVTMVERAGVPYPIAIASIVIEGIFGLLGALVIVVVGSLGTTLGPSASALSSLMVVVLAVGVTAILAWSRLRRPSPIASWALDISIRRLASIGAAFILIWLAIGAAYWLVANAIAPLPGSLWFHLTVAVAVATGLGHLALFAPGGIGVRDGALYLLVSEWMTYTDALAFVALTRLIAIGIESLLTAAAGYRLFRGDRPPSSSVASQALPGGSDSRR